MFSLYFPLFPSFSLFPHLILKCFTIFPLFSLFFLFVLLSNKQHFFPCFVLAIFHPPLTRFFESGRKYTLKGADQAEGEGEGEEGEGERREGEKGEGGRGGAGRFYQ